jgi:DNA invertase Pin-like site-specific DNA recombinase
MAVYKSNEATKDGRTWYYAVKYKKPNGEKNRKKSKKFATEKEAQDAERKFLEANEENYKKIDIAFEDMYHEYLDYIEESIKGSTKYTKKSLFKNHILNYFGEMNIHSITVNTVLDWKSKINKKTYGKGKKYSLQYKKMLMSELRAVLNYGMNFCELKENIARKVMNFQDKNEAVISDEEKIRYITPDEYNLFTSVIDKLLFKVFFAFLYYMGVRKGEAQALTWEDILWDISKVRVIKTITNKTDELNENGFRFKITNTKNRKNRTIKMSRIVRFLLLELYMYYSEFEGFNSKWFVFGGNRHLPSKTIDREKDRYFALARETYGKEIKGVFTDEAYTGTRNTRKGLQALLDECRKGSIRQIVTKSISRFARNTVDLLNIAHEMRAIGVGIYFEEQLIDTLSCDGELMLTILASYAQEESRSASENQKWRIRKCYQEGKPTNPIEIYGYDYKNGVLTVIPEEADVVRMIFFDYLGGMGKNAIMKKLTKLGVPTKTGGRWTDSTVTLIIKNEKYIGDTCLQKGFIADHITKRHKPNRGELPKYYVEGTHEAIIDKETFDAAQAEIARRAAKVRTSKTKTQSEFAGLIKCGRCGASFCRKVSASGTKYAKAIWICRTFVYRGKSECPAKRIPEDILKEKCAEMMGLSEYDADKFKAVIAAITIPDDGVLVFAFKDSTERTVEWQHRSRRESWTDEMKAAASKRMKEVRANG